MKFSSACNESRTHPGSQDELGHLHRAANALRKLGFCVETESGRTDEGEPWFLIWDANLCEMMVHVANIDRKYVIWFPNRNDSFSGYNLPELIERFTEALRRLANHSR
jgi:hypothetical protein